MSWASLVAQMVKHLPAMQETRVESLGWEDSLEKEMATHSGTLARKIPWTEEPGRLQTMGLQTVGHDRATSLSADGGGEAHPCGAFLRPLSMGCTPFPVSFCARDLATWPHTDCTGLGNDHPGQQPPSGRWHSPCLSLQAWGCGLQEAKIQPVLSRLHPPRLPKPRPRPEVEAR